MKASNKKPKVVIAMNDFLIGGIQKLAVDQITLLKEEFEFVVIILMQSNTGTFYHLIPEGISVYKMNFKNFWDIRSWIELIKIMRYEKPRIVKTAMFFANTVFRIIKPLFGYVVITAEHNTETARQWGYKVVDFLLAPLTYTIIADSNTVAQFVSKTEHIRMDKFTVIYNGVELDQINNAESIFSKDREEIRAEMKCNSKDIIFLTVARLVKQKDHELMINGFAKYLSMGGVGKLVIIGYGQLRETLEQQVHNLNIANQVVFMGAREDIYRFYSASDYFILTSVREGFCISAMNGLAFGLPLISTRVAGVIEYLEDGKNGYFVEATPEGVAEILTKITNLPQETLFAMKKYAKTAADNFGVEAHADKYRKLFKTCLVR